MTEHERFVLAWIVLQHDTPLTYCKNPCGPVPVWGARLRTARKLYGKGLVLLKKDEHDEMTATPTDTGRRHVACYKPDTPERQVIMWLVKQPTMTQLAKFSVETFWPRIKVEQEPSYYSTDRKYAGTRIRRPGKGRHGKKYKFIDMNTGEVLHENDRADPNRRVRETVEWLHEQLKKEKKA